MIEEKKIKEFNAALKNKNLTMVCAESITAGLLSSTIASVSGASNLLKGSIVTYSRELKSSILKVDPRVIDKYSAESMETTVEMVYGLIKIYPSADIYAAVTGIASRSTPEYPVNGEVGDVFIAIYFSRARAEKRLTEYRVKIDESDRNVIREQAVKIILEKVLEVIN
jgi:nicotinamide-nucleotide amidase